MALASDARVDSLSADFPASEIASIPSATPSGRSPLKRAGAVLTLGRGFGVAAKEIRRINPAAIVGFGGYPTVPPMLAAQGISSMGGWMGGDNFGNDTGVTAVETARLFVGQAARLAEDVVTAQAGQARQGQGQDGAGLLVR